ncbi:DUF7149 domain-containing protein [Algoriphagus marinus]|uniref:DUF7149 domain-containing protein n=1 Tax=Algoriphagus marinus TaxID=1925762 RepID=UPI000B0531E0|nr:DUF559 domain-containing protein [Algoriphagus marinus]
MAFTILKPKQALNKAFLKVKPNRTEIEGFKSNLIQLIDHSNEIESEEFHKNLVIDFLKKTYYDPNHYINTKGRNDLVIHNGDKAKSTVGVIIEAKKPTNKSEMPKAFANTDKSNTPSEQMLSASNINYKAFQELVLYYLRERITHKNLEVKHLIVTNINEWFIFDAQVFDRNFAQNKGLVKQFEDFEAGRLSEVKTDFFYKHIAEPEIEKVKAQIDFTYFDIRSYEKPLRNADKKDDSKLIALYKLLSPEHLLKLPFANDSNSLDKRFYSELLHIIGLTETKEGGKKLIGRSKAGERNSGSILEDAIIQLDSLDKLGQLEKPSQYGNTTQERLFNVGLELSITWINRVLFLKLLEAQLITYHKGDKSYAFLNKKNIHDWDDLNSLFFQVLAKKTEDRNEDVKALFAKVPYLNSSLFEPTPMEQKTIMINFLKNEKTIPVISSTVLKNEQGKKLTGSLTTLEYLFKFLDAYDFASEGSEEIQEDNKTLINASVLGLIFEKINGYKDGSFFTPGFITMYMCRETIRRAVLQKFREALNNLSQNPARSAKNTNLTPNPSPSRRGELPRSDSHTSLSFGRGIEGEGNIKKIDPVLLQHAREMRKNPTQAEDFFWQLVRNRKLLGYKFRRQHPVDQKFVLDFFCNELMLGIELDGGYHEDIGQKEYDEGRSYELNELGITILRFSNEEAIWETEKIFEAVKHHSEKIHSSLSSGRGIEGEGFIKRGTEGEGIIIRGIEGEGQKTREINSLSDVYDIIGPNELFSYAEANSIVNSIKICDPAVGSGHFLVSALNEIIAVKNDLKILQDRTGKRLKEYHVEVVNDELIVTDEDGDLFEYNPSNKESQRIQETLFHEKQTIIENCLFGVDINPNSVKICRLRLWIELLKSAYYKTLTPASPKGEEPSSLSFGRGIEGEGFVRELETLPNIDINIKCGNSLVSRFALDEDLSQALKKSKFSIDAYRLAVDRYRNAESKEEKREMESLINTIKSDFRSEIAKNDPKIKKKAALGGELYNLTMQTGLFEETPKDKKIRLVRVEKVTAELNKLDSEIEEIKANQIFENAFEWRFEFPEVLNDAGEFVGFDVVIGNPPYIRQEEFSALKPYLQDRFTTYAGTADLYVYFVELSMTLLKNSGNFVFIIPNKWMRAGYGKALRNYVKTFEIHELLDFGDLQVFEEATTYPLIIGISKNIPNEKFTAVNLDTLDFPLGMNNYLDDNRIEVLTVGLSADGWTLTDSKSQQLLLKLKSQGVPLSEYVEGKIYRGVLTGLNEAFVIDQETKDRLIAEDPRSAEVIKPFLAGRDIKRYQQPKSDKFLIFTRRGIAIENYSTILSYLEGFREGLEPKPKDFKGSNWKGRKPGTYKWYEIQDAVDYYEEFEKAKILWPGISSEITSFGFDQENFYGNDNNQMIITNDLYLLGFLNSSVSKFILKNTCDFVRGGFARLKISYVSQTPIYKATTEQKEIISEISMKIIGSKKDYSDTIALENQIDQLIYEMYGLSEEEIGIVEGRNQ